jgi:trans-2,3-dihydro-3-hydroxyanthranilate isomerase
LRFHFVLADVFTDRPLAGNQLGVFTDARGMTSTQMQAFARELNFSESTFVLPPEIANAAKRVLIFTPTAEIPMAGHPTVGTAFVLASRGDLPITGDITEVTLQLGIGPVTVSIEGSGNRPGLVWMKHPPPTPGRVRDDRARVAHAVGIDETDLTQDLPIQFFSTGLNCLFVPIRSVEALGKCRSHAAALAALLGEDGPAPVYMFVVSRADNVTVRARMFAPGFGVIEDPATGGAAAPLGGYLATYGLLPQKAGTDFVIEQGIEMGRPSRIYVEVQRRSDGAVEHVRIGGLTQIIGEGEMFCD